MRWLITTASPAFTTGCLPLRIYKDWLEDDLNMSLVSVSWLLPMKTHDGLYPRYIWWSLLKSASQYFNSKVHPKDTREISVSGTNQWPQMFHIPRLFQIHQWRYWMAQRDGLNCGPLLTSGLCMSFRVAHLFFHPSRLALSRSNFQDVFPPEILPARWNASVVHISPLLTRWWLVGGGGRLEVVGSHSASWLWPLVAVLKATWNVSLAEDLRGS